jgi:hypothetical protein
MKCVFHKLSEPRNTIIRLRLSNLFAANYLSNTMQLCGLLRMSLLFRRILNFILSHCSFDLKGTFAPHSLLGIKTNIS